MMLCLALLGEMASAVVLGEHLTLTWNHSVEKILWSEQYQARADGLWRIAAVFRGHGAGMEIPEGAMAQKGAWISTTPQKIEGGLLLSHSSFVGEYNLCVGDSESTPSGCYPLTAWLPNLPDVATVQLIPCSSLIQPQP